MRPTRMKSNTLPLDELALGATRFMRLLVPALEDRTPITARTFPYTLLHIAPLLFLAYLARRPDTRVVRMLLLPSVVMLTMHSCFGYVWTGRGMNVYNWGEALAGMVCIAKALDFAFIKDGHFKVGERTPGTVHTPAISKKDYDPLDPSSSPKEITGLHRPGSSFLPTALSDALELFFAFRGVGWDWGAGVYIPAEHKPLARGPFLLATLRSFLLSYIALDALESLIKLVPGVGLPTGGSIFLTHLPPTERYTLSTLIHFASGFALLAGFQMVYDLSTLTGVFLLGHDPTSWPPVLSAPWASTSLHEFWSRRWHQLLRQTFLVYGGYPTRILLGPRAARTLPGRAAVLLATFTASGAYHELSSAALGRGLDARVIAFFALQGALVLGERVWRAVTGKRVGGWAGRVWVYFVIGVLGQPMIDAWHKKGLAGGMIIPPGISPTRQLFFPLISRLTGLNLEVYPL